MDSKRFKDLLSKYRTGTATTEERRLVEEWYHELGRDAAPAAMTDEGPGALRNSIYAGVSVRIDQPAPARRRPITQLRNIAASLILFMVIGWWIWQSLQSPATPSTSEIQLVEITADQGKLKNIILPDSSEIWLNAGSKLTFHIPFESGDTREVSLEYGEAYFDVRRDTLRPFVVHASGLETRVLGTTFTVKAYQQLEDISVSVLTGRVEVSGRDRLVLGVLHPGDRLVYGRQQRTHTLLRGQATDSHSWIHGVTYLSQATFTELSVILENAYGIRLKAGDQRITRQKYSIQLDRNTRTEDIIKAICGLYGDRYRKEGDIITIY